MKLKKALFKEILFQYKQFFSYDVEFSFAHMLTYGLSGKNNLKNLEKANDHLLRGALDGLKALVLLNMDEIKRNDKLLKNLITLRVEEAKSIGQIQNNKIIDKYIKFLQTISQ